MPFVFPKRTARSEAFLAALAAFLHFDVCFMVCMLLGALSIPLKTSLHLDAAQQGLLVAMPILSGSLMRLPVGLLSDRFSGKWVGVGMLGFLFFPLLVGWLVPLDFSAVLVVGLMLGVAGASLAVALPLASRWYPPTRQGLVMGITATGTLGNVVAISAAPTLAHAFGWQVVLGLAVIPLALVLLLFLWLAKDSPTRPRKLALTHYLATMGQGDLWWFCLLYSVTFGGFIGLSSFLPQFYHNHFGVSAVEAGLWAAGASFVGCVVRPLGGYLADQSGGMRLLTISLVGVFGLYILVSFPLPLVVTGPLFILGMACLGIGNGSLFQLVPQRFRAEIGVATGLVGTVGGLGGFVLSFLLGSVKHAHGTYTSGWLIMALFTLIALVALRVLMMFRVEWCSSWRENSQAEAVASAFPPKGLRKERSA
jgi:NNP family nitrate/nitrite transporter-like MFS transporter